MKVIHDESGFIYHQMMDTAQDPSGKLTFTKVDVPAGKTLVRFENGEPVYVDRPLTNEEKLADLEKEITSNQLALAEILENQTQG